MERKWWLAALVLTAGSLADRLGWRRLFAAGLAIFSLASLLCALAPDPTFLNVARALQGVVSLAGAVLALWLVRAREIKRRPEPEPEPAVQPEMAAA